MNHKKLIISSIIAMLLLISVIVGVLFSTSMVGPTKADARTDPRFRVKGRVSNKQPGKYQDPEAVCALFQTSNKRKFVTTCSQNVDRESFDLKLDMPLEDEAILQYGYGYGRIIGGFNSSLVNPLPNDPKLTGGLSEVAWANKFAIIYINGTLPNEVKKCHWLHTFPQGYSCGSGTGKVTCTGFEGYQPVDCGEVVLNVDSRENMGWIKFS